MSVALPFLMYQQLQRNFYNFSKHPLLKFIFAVLRFVDEKGLNDRLLYCIKVHNFYYRAHLQSNTSNSKIMIGRKFEVSQLFFNNVLFYLIHFAY